MTPSQCRAIISHLDKKDKDLLWIKNWRPLSMLDVDYKILTKIMGNHLKEALPEVISHSQKGFLADRYIRSILIKLQKKNMSRKIQYLHFC